MPDPFVEEENDDLDYWRLCDELSVYQAALLTAGHSPSKFPYVEQWDAHKRPKGYDPAMNAIRNALRGQRIKGTITREVTTDFNGNSDSDPDSVDVFLSRVEVESLKDWLASRGVRRGFFFPEQIERPDYLDSRNVRYAPKLAAAVQAWLAVTETGGKTPKQALSKWLREHAAEFDLTDEDGNPNETGIEEAAKVANWQPGGGAPKTPGNS